MLNTVWIRATTECAHADNNVSLICSLFEKEKEWSFEKYVQSFWIFILLTKQNTCISNQIKSNLFENINIIHAYTFTYTLHNKFGILSLRGYSSRINRFINSRLHHFIGVSIPFHMELIVSQYYDHNETYGPEKSSVYRARAIGLLEATGCSVSVRVAYPHCGSDPVYLCIG